MSDEPQQSTTGISLCSPSTAVGAHPASAPLQEFYKIYIRRALTDTIGDALQSHRDDRDCSLASSCTRPAPRDTSSHESKSFHARASVDTLLGPPSSQHRPDESDTARHTNQAMEALDKKDCV